MPGKQDKAQQTNEALNRKIIIAEGVVGWTVNSIANLVTQSAFQLPLMVNNITYKVQTEFGTSCMGSAGTSGQEWVMYRAVISLDARPTSSFSNGKDEMAVAHEYGHAWTTYHYYITHQKNWTPWLEVRGLVGDPRLDTSYTWTISELIADDYRMLFGSAAAVAQANYIQPNLTDPRNVSGLKDWFTNVWTKRVYG